jgi:hypothetical protein
MNVMSVVPTSSAELAASDSRARLPVERAAAALAATSTSVTTSERKAAFRTREELGALAPGDGGAAMGLEV